MSKTQTDGNLTGAFWDGADLPGGSLLLGNCWLKTFIEREEWG